MNISEDILERACNTECPRFSAGNCPYYDESKECCERVAEAIRTDEKVEKDFMKCLQFSCELFRYWGNEDSKDRLRNFLEPLTQKGSQLSCFLSYFFQTAYQMGKPFGKAGDKESREEEI